MLCIVAWVLYVYTKNVAMPDNATLRTLCFVYSQCYHVVKAEQYHGIVPLLAIPPPSAVFVVPGVGLG